MKKTVLSFYVDDTNPYVAPPSAFAEFLDFVSAEGAAGESSVILGYDWQDHGHLSLPGIKNQDAYIQQVQRAYRCGIDSQFELYTHHWLFDFQAARYREGYMHEGRWLYEPGVSLAEYEAYFSSILDQADQLGFRYTGMTWPGCGCPACSARYEELQAKDAYFPNPYVYTALLNLVKAGRFRGRTINTFFGGEIDHARAHVLAQDGDRAVFFLPPNLGDRCGIWENDPAWVNADYYISADGQSGKMVELVRAGEPYVMFYNHWQGSNPANGVGWTAFKQVVQRVQKYLRDDVVWMRPTQYTDSLLAEASA